jgi:hypothetical protein
MISPADELRTAAKRIREIAEKATDGQRLVEYDGDEMSWVVMNDKVGMDQHAIGWFVTAQNPRAEADANLMRMFNRSAALLVAALLENSADALAPGAANHAERVLNTETWYRHELAIARAVNASKETTPCGSCDDTKWVDDENWQPEQWELARGRRPGSGRIPCGICNHGGWDEDDGAASTPTTEAQTHG